MDTIYSKDNHGTHGVIVNCTGFSVEQRNGNRSPDNSDTLDLSKKKLHYLSEELYMNTPCIKNMHLEGNVLCSLPDSLFLHLPHLVWLDLRYNEITSLPITIGKHRQLKYLLLEGNPIKTLPVELGDLSTLKALNLRHCPLEFPPADIVRKGLESILSFLRNVRRVDPVSSKRHESDLPPVEKLNLNELDLSDECSTKEEMKQFQMLKNKIKEKEMEEMAQIDPLHLYSKPQKVLGPGKTSGWRFLTESRQVLPVERRYSEADRQAEEKERLGLLYQKQKNQEILKDWQKQTKVTQDQKAKNRKRTENQHEVPIAVPPYATELDPSQNKNSWDKHKTLVVEKQEMMPRVMSVKSLKEAEKARASRDFRLEQRIKQHVQAMQERQRNPKRSAQEEMEAARKELEMASLLQAEILQRRREHDTSLEYRFTAFTGDISPSTTPRGQPQNIFAMDVS
ncbi:leucine-rich repeat-containing protein 27 isoform X2 [Mixophyes fleayi]|uniref:leucine-rich repeat-containing protein 27 isoform X2 n=1 Tax=Mixophyes fleayi TaxID=3061075 RepID=UPI003F4DC37D